MNNVNIGRIRGYMPSPYLSEDQCSHEFYNQVRCNFGLLPIRTHSTKIEALEGADVIYEVKSAMKRNVKAVWAPI